jgi:hypothetical protein
MCSPDTGVICSFGKRVEHFVRFYADADAMKNIGHVELLCV